MEYKGPNSILGVIQNEKLLVMQVLRSACDLISPTFTEWVYASNCLFCEQSLSDYHCNTINCTLSFEYDHSINNNTDIGKSMGD